MFPTDKGALEAMTKPGREMFEYWISFFPTAPMFGVKWRFGEMMPTNGTMPWTVPGMPTVSAKTSTPTTAKAQTPTKADVVELKPKTPATPKATPKKAVAKNAASAPAKAADPAPASTKVSPVPVEVAKQPKPAKKPAKASTKAAPKAADGRPAGLLAEKPAAVDDLKLIKGIGPGLEKELNGLGVYQFAQMAEFQKPDLEWIDDNLTAFKGRCFRDDWTGQAKALLG